MNWQEICNNPAFNDLPFKFETAGYAIKTAPCCFLTRNNNVLAAPLFRIFQRK
jgi:hypothetical protein